jgi:hypothetical protein
MGSYGLEQRSYRATIAAENKETRVAGGWESTLHLYGSGDL